MRWTLATKILAILVFGFGIPISASADGWKYVPADPPVTLPDLIAKGGQVEGWLGGRASSFIPNLDADADFVAGGTLISYDRKLYRCVTRDGESVGDGNCFVAVNK